MGQVVEIWLTGKRAPEREIAQYSAGTRKNADLRSREYLLPEEVYALVTHAGKAGRHRARDRILNVGRRYRGLPSKLL